MMGPGHRVAAVTTWLGLAPHLGVTGWRELTIGAVIAGACGHGRLSPDADHSTYPILSRIVPGGHRGILHVPAIPAAAAWAAPTAGVYGWQVLAVALAWGSHVAADAIFGRIPVFPRSRGRWHRVGLGLPTGGVVERRLVVPLLAVAGVCLAVQLAVGVVR